MQDNASIVRRIAGEVITRGKMESAAQFVWEDIITQVPLPGQGPGLEAVNNSRSIAARGEPLQGVSRAGGHRSA